MSGRRVFTYSFGESFRYWVPIGISFVVGFGGFLISGEWFDQLLWGAFWWYITIHGCFLERARRQRPSTIITHDEEISALWKNGKTATTPWVDVSKVVVERQPHRDDLTKVSIAGRPGSTDIVFTHRINDYQELFQAVRRSSSQAEFEEVYLWQRKKLNGPL